jgi:SAM-dependent methyltransferase
MGIVAKIHQKLFGHPFVYDKVRPFVLGGIDYSRMYASLDAGPDSVVLDIGCGTGNALEYLTSFSRYVGIDTDEKAVRAARSRYGKRDDVTFFSKICTPADIDSIRPTHVVLAGVLHHLDDESARSLLALVRTSPALRRVGTLDIVYVRGMIINNVLASLDRGRHCRKAERYRALAEDSGFAVADQYLMGNRPDGGGGFRYWVMMLELPR